MSGSSEFKDRPVHLPLLERDTEWERHSVRVRPQSPLNDADRLLAGYGRVAIASQLQLSLSSTSETRLLTFSTTSVQIPVQIGGHALIAAGRHENLRGRQNPDV